MKQMDREHNKDKKKTITIMAGAFSEGDFNADSHDFGEGLIIDGNKGQGFACYKFIVEKKGGYELWSRYATGERRPVELYIDNKLVKKSGLRHITDGWTKLFLKWHKEMGLQLNSGEHTLKIISRQCIPHIDRFVIHPKGQPRSFKDRAQEDLRPNNQGKLSLFAHKAKNIFLNSAHNLIPDHLKDLSTAMVGVYDGSYGYRGPFCAQLDLTNSCNNNCIACWCNSPLFKTPRLSEKEKRQHLPFGLVKELLDDFSRMGVKDVYYSGSGEPFTHPQIMEILEYTKKKGIMAHSNTNFTMFNKQRLDTLIDIGMDFLTISLWSATPATYAKTHPNKSEEDFHKIKENLIYLNAHKKGKPYIKLYNVLFNMNYFETEKMVELATQTRSDSLEFTLIDTMPGVTDVLALNEKQFKELTEACRRIGSNLDKDYMVKGDNVLIFKFDQFLRRISHSCDVQGATYDRNIVESMPCYIGWLFARIIPNGEVHSCLKAHRIPTGNLYQNRFLEIWNSKNQAYFRKKTLTYKKTDSFFKNIGNDPNIKGSGCYKSCDDINRNIAMHNNMKALKAKERLALKAIAKTLKVARKLKLKNKAYKNYHKDPLIAGIIHGRKAFIGPEQAFIEPTNKNNLQSSLSRPEKELSKSQLTGLINDLANLGTKRIRFTGNGEPFMHKDLLKVIEHARGKGLSVAVDTNFVLVPKQDIQRLIDLGLEELRINISAANKELKDNLLYLKEAKGSKLLVTFVNMEDFQKGIYDRAEINKTPCYAGWISSRVLANGDVVPCSRGAGNTMGNINERPFKDIWFCPEYDEFRAKAKYLPKENAYFEKIGCIKGCGDLMYNQQMHKRL